MIVHAAEVPELWVFNIFVQSRPKLTKALEEDDLDGLVDPSMGANYDAVGMQRLIACAAAAVRHTARSRPRMSQVTDRPLATCESQFLSPLQTLAKR